MVARQALVACRYSGSKRARVAPYCQPAALEDDEKHQQRPRRLQHAEEQISAGQQAPRQQPFAARAGRALHHGRVGLFRAQRQRRQHVGAEIDRQDLDDGERQRDS